MKNTKSKVKRVDNSIEKLLGTNLGSWDEALGLRDPEKKQRQTSGDLEPGIAVSLTELHRKNSEAKEEKIHIEPGIDYAREIIHTGENLSSRESQELETQLRELMAEIKKLADSSKELQMQFKEIAVEQHAVKPGKYHKTFFAWLFSVIKAARMKVEDSGAWLAAMHSKKKSREYGAMAKKHGTTFSLSNERVVATQVG